jgi:imidazoleglycerol-phosphate dehydratase/histidinol-phosphatase
MRGRGVSARKLLFIDRDGTLLVEPADEQVDRYGKFALINGVIPALRRCMAVGYELVMVTNQDGLGTPSFPQADFAGPQNLLLQILRSQDIEFREVLVDGSFAHEGKDTRKPGVGLMRAYLADDSWSRAASAVIGDRDTDLQFAANLGVRGFKLGADWLGTDWNWDAIAHALCDAPRLGDVERNTKETKIRVCVDLDRVAIPTVATGLGFFDHMLEQIGKHGGFALALNCTGDAHVDEHHIVEDCALALGAALRQALADKRGILRYGAACEDAGGGCYGAAAESARTDKVYEVLLPMDETLARAALDLSGRSYFVFDGVFSRERVGDLPTELVPHFFRSLCDGLGANLHLAVRGDNAHHMVEACFKAVARALRQALRREGDELPSTKGVL